MKFPLIVTCTVLFPWHLPSLVKRGQDNKNVTFVQSRFPFGQATAKGDGESVYYQPCKEAFYQTCCCSAFAETTDSGQAVTFRALRFAEEESSRG